MSSYTINRLFEMIWGLLCFMLVIYALISIGKKVVSKLKQKFTNEEKISYMRKKNILDAVKLLFGAQVVGLLFYITPAINENIKIALSLIITLGVLVASGFVQEKKGLNGTCRALVFIGQEFFGITMILLMVSKGIGYSMNTVFALWTIFNFYIMKKVGKAENKALFWITLGILVVSLLGNFVNEMDIMMALILICVVILAIQLFGNKENFGVILAENVCFTLLLITTWNALGTTDISFFAGFVTIAFVIGVGAVAAIRYLSEGVLPENFNVRALLLYIPYIAILLTTEITLDILLGLGLFNIIVAILFVSEDSTYKKVLAGFVLLLVGFVGMDATNIDEGIFAIIYFSAVIVGYAYLLTPAMTDRLEEGGEEYDEE